MFDLLESQQQLIEESVSTDVVADFHTKKLRNDAMSILLSWVEAEDFSFETLDGLILEFADANGDEAIGEEEEEHYEALSNEVVQGLVFLGISGEAATHFMESEEEEAGQRIGEALTELLSQNGLSDEAIIAQYLSGGSSLIQEAKMRVVRGGKVRFINKRIKRKKLSSAQRAALKKARRKAHSASAKRNRAKSRRTRQRRGF